MVIFWNHTISGMLHTFSSRLCDHFIELLSIKDIDNFKIMHFKFTTQLLLHASLAFERAPSED